MDHVLRTEEVDKVLPNYVSPDGAVATGSTKTSDSVPPPKR